MDAVTIAINSLNNELLTSVAVLLDDSLVYSFILILIVFWLTRNNKNKMGRILVALVVVFLVGTAIKTLTEVSRPCEELILKTDCGGGYSFPSLHAATAFTLALGFLNDRRYLWVLLFSLFVSFTRIYLGVHTFVDIAAALVISPIVYSLVDFYWKRGKL